MEGSNIEKRYPTSPRVDEIVRKTLGVYSEIILSESKLIYSDVVDAGWTLNFVLGTHNTHEGVTKGVEYLYEKNGLYLYFRQDQHIIQNYNVKILFEPKRLSEVELFIKQLKRIKK